VRKKQSSKKSRKARSNEAFQSSFTQPAPTQEYPFFKERPTCGPQGHKRWVDHQTGKVTEFYCGSIHCAHPMCQKKRVRKTKLMLAALIREYKLNFFATLTLDPSKIPGQTEEEKLRTAWTSYLKYTWHKFMTMIRRKYRGIKFVAVIEPHVSMYPHIHAFFSVEIKQADLIEKFCTCGGGYISSIAELEDYKQAAAYVADYCAKEVSVEPGPRTVNPAFLKYCPKGTRFLLRSKKLKTKFETKQQNKDWHPQWEAWDLREAVFEDDAFDSTSYYVAQEPIEKQPHFQQHLAELRKQFPQKCYAKEHAIELQAAYFRSLLYKDLRHNLLCIKASELEVVGWNIHDPKQRQIPVDERGQFQIANCANPFTRKMPQLVKLWGIRKPHRERVMPWRSVSKKRYVRFFNHPLLCFPTEQVLLQKLYGPEWYRIYYIKENGEEYLPEVSNSKPTFANQPNPKTIQHPKEHWFGQQTFFLAVKQNKCYQHLSFFEKNKKDQKAQINLEIKQHARCKNSRRLKIGKIKSPKIKLRSKAFREFQLPLTGNPGSAHKVPEKMPTQEYRCYLKYSAYIPPLPPQIYFKRQKYIKILKWPKSYKFQPVAPNNFTHFPPNQNLELNSQDHINQNFAQDIPAQIDCIFQYFEDIQRYASDQNAKLNHNLEPANLGLQTCLRP